jgi:dolichyl-phosphate-mannose--protein O-mannosyl transferase
VKKILNECERMLSYHGTPGLGMDHFFYSPWYEWPFAVTPMWYSSSRFEAAGLESSIMAFGNPAVWWVGAVTLAAVAVCFLVRHVQKDMTVCLHTKKWDARPAVLIICFLAQYLPWTLVPRGTYIYHYFTAVPFVILANTLIYAWLEDKMKGLGKWLFVIQCALALGLFIAFFPYISGVAVPVRWMDAMKWFPDWLYY